MKPAFKLPDRKVDDWVAGGGDGRQQAWPPQEERTPPAPKPKSARLTVDLDPDLHARFKAACALNATDMVTEIRQFIEDWTETRSR